MCQRGGIKSPGVDTKCQRDGHLVPEGCGPAVCSGLCDLEYLTLTNQISPFLAALL